MSVPDGTVRVNIDPYPGSAGWFAFVVDGSLTERDEFAVKIGEQVGYWVCVRD